ncbi:hypothetical protein [Shouchella patagoniensis]|uniref:hypothetical protein n=1 Tax=Shouchella patagoniensis TaxID=228576 RepID=UPI000995A5C8|nr:hypothetical protein [Shouchella patagoniensis]
MFDFNLYEYQELISSPWIWVAFFGYGIVSSFLIDFIGRFLRPFTRNKQMVLYILFGYLAFVFFLPPLLFILYAGTIGALFSLLFFLGTTLAKKSIRYSLLVFVIPIGCLLLLPFDVTSKENWQEERGEDFVEVHYDAFNGEHLIPVQGRSGDRVYFTADHQIGNSSAHGLTAYDENKQYLGMNEENEEGVRSIDFIDDTTYYIVVRGIEAEDGTIRVDWWFEE